MCFKVEQISCGLISNDDSWTMATLDRNYYVYILSSKTRVLYIGVTNDLEKRLWQHKQHLIPGFTKRYNVDKLVYFEHTQSIEGAIEREKHLKGWLRAKKVALIESVNPTWAELSAQWNRPDSSSQTPQNDTALKKEILI